MQMLSVLEVGPYRIRVRRNCPPLVALYLPRVTLPLRTPPVNQRLTNRIGVSTPCGAVLTKENLVPVRGLSELSGYGRISEPRMGRYPPVLALTL